MQQLLFADLPLCLPYIPTASGVVEEIATADANGDIWEAVNHLRSQGWDYHGEDSAYCTVLISPDGDRVLKLGNGSGAEATLNAAIALPDNPHLPKVFASAFLDGGVFTFAAEMEFLEDLPDKDDYSEDDFDDTAPSCSDDRNQCPSFYRWRSSVPWRGSTYAGPALSSMPDGPLKDALAALAEHGSGCSWDVHDGNIMVRPSDGTIVLNDLLA